MNTSFASLDNPGVPKIMLNHIYAVGPGLKGDDNKCYIKYYQRFHNVIVSSKFSKVTS